MTHSAEMRARVRGAVTLAFDAIAPVWPLGGFVATNPLSGFEYLPFQEAIRRMHQQTGARGFLPENTYRAWYREGRISLDALEQALDRVSPRDQSRRLLGHDIDRRSLLRYSLLTDPANCEIDQTIDLAVVERLLRFVLPASIARHETAPVPTLAHLVDQRHGTDLRRLIDERMTFWCAAFLDEGEAVWSMPYRDRGFYRSWRRLAAYERHPSMHVVRAECDAMLSHALPEDALIALLNAMGVEQSAWKEYFAAHVLQLPGWAGFVKWRASHADDVVQRESPIDPVQYLAVRLFYEWNVVSALSVKRDDTYTYNTLLQKVHLTVPTEEEQRQICATFSQIATYLHMSQRDILSLNDEDIAWILQSVLWGDVEQRSALWLHAHEIHLRDATLTALHHVQHSFPANMVRQNLPNADVVFCIDVRCESIRRNLESLGNYRTRGFAGFYGLPISLQFFESDSQQPSAPVLLKPKHHLIEQALGNPEQISRYSWRTHCMKKAKNLFAKVKEHIASPFTFFETVGLFFSIVLVGRTLLPYSFFRLYERVMGFLLPSIKTTFPLESRREHDMITGFTHDERVFFAESALTLMGMRRDFSPLVVFMGHGSTSENNPFAASLDCGACAGYRGGPNARILASLLNRSDVREALVGRGIHIPTETLFIGAEHDTTSDRVTFFDTDTSTAVQKSALRSFEEDLRTALLGSSRERQKALTRSNQAVSPSPLEGRAYDWAQIRPEWGLARNAMCIIAPRTFSKSVDLESRAFLHEYHPEDDRDGTVLEIIMTAPLIVAQWINAHYYFAAVDNDRYGSGTKVLHQIVGRIGVLEGNQGDLRVGLPLQSLADGVGLYHEPLRMLTIITSPRERISAIIARNSVLQHLFHNEWISLVAWDSESQCFWLYRPDASWEPYSTAETALEGSLR